MNVSVTEVLLRLRIAKRNVDPILIESVCIESTSDVHCYFAELVLLNAFFRLHFFQQLELLGDSDVETLK